MKHLHNDLIANNFKPIGESSKTILILDVVQSRLSTAHKLGVDYTLLVKKEYTDEQVVDKILKILGTQPNVTIDACGYASAQRIAMTVCLSLTETLKSKQSLAIQCRYHVNKLCFTCLISR